MHAEIQESSPISVPVHHGPKNGRSKYFIRRSIVASISLILAFLFRDTLCDLIALWAVIIFFASEKIFKRYRAFLCDSRTACLHVASCVIFGGLWWPTLLTSYIHSRLMLLPSSVQCRLDSTTQQRCQRGWAEAIALSAHRPAAMLPCTCLYESGLFLIIIIINDDDNDVIIIIVII